MQKPGEGTPALCQTFRHFPNPEFLCALCVGTCPDSVGAANSFKTFRPSDIPTFAPFSATMGGLRAQGHNCGTDEAAGAGDAGVRRSGRDWDRGASDASGEERSAG